MQTLYPQCAGLDVHKETVVACARTVAAGRVQHEVETFATTVRGLPCASRSANHTASFTSLLRPGTLRTSAGLARTSSQRPSSTCQTGRQ